jgi:transcription antitermination factor NusG
MDALPPVADWAVAHVKARTEKVLVEFFDKRHVKSYLPMVRHRRVYGARVRESLLPLFPGYVFFDKAGISYHHVFDSRKVAQVLYTDNPAKLKHDLENIALALAAGQDITEIAPPKPGQRAVVVAGPLKGLEGEVLRQSGKTTLIVRIEFLAKAAELAIDEAYLHPLK